jgi:hypothetical protein
LFKPSLKLGFNEFTKNKRKMEFLAANKKVLVALFCYRGLCGVDEFIGSGYFFW